MNFFSNGMVWYGLQVQLDLVCTIGLRERFPDVIWVHSRHSPDEEALERASLLASHGEQALVLSLPLPRNKV